MPWFVIAFFVFAGIVIILILIDFFIEAYYHDWTIG